jgi:putative ABC transport system permease protein
MDIPLPERRYPTREARNAFFLQLLERAREVPGLKEVALNQSVHPFVYFGARIAVPGSSVQAKTSAMISQISSDYPEMMNLKLLQGRLFTPEEVRAAKQVAFVNERFAKFYFSNRGVIGQPVQLVGLRDPPETLANDMFEIVGVVSDLRNAGLQRETRPEVYIPFTASGYMGLSTTLLATGHIPAAKLAKPLEDKLHAMDPDQPVMNVRTLQQLLDAGGYAEPRFSVFLFGVFATLGLALAALGIYAVINYSVIRQTQEIGVRMALGAQRGNILNMIVGSGAKLLAIGTALGLLGSLGLNHFLTSMIWGVSPFDPLSFTAVILILFAIGLAACIRPALRASHVDPMKALRYE